MSVSSKYVVSLMVSDRPGIMRDITSAITDLGANIDDISQTVVEGYFSVILTATFEPERSEDDIRSAIQSSFGPNEPSILVRACGDMPAAVSISDGDSYVLVVTGKDRPGIMKKTTGFLADRSINIDDWTCQIEEGTVSYIGQITVPSGVDVKQLQVDLKSDLSALGMSASIRHENIFRATNEIGPIKHLLK